MKRKGYSKQETMAKNMREYLNRRQLLSYGIKSGLSLSIPGFLSTLLAETTAFAGVDRGKAKVPVVQIHAAGGPLEYIFPRLANGDLLSRDLANGALLEGYGVAKDILERTDGTRNLMGLTWFNRTRLDTTDINNTPVKGTDDFIVSLEKQAMLIQSIATPTTPAAPVVDFNKVHAYNIAADSDDDDANGEHNCNNVLTASGFKGTLVDSMDITGGVRASQALKFAFNPFAASGSKQIRDLISYAPAFSTRSQTVLNSFTASLKDLGDLQASKLFAKMPEDQKIRTRESLSTSFQDNKNSIDPDRFNTKLDISGAQLPASADPNYAQAFDFSSMVAGPTLATPDILAYATGLEAICKGISNFMGYTFNQGMDYHQNAAVIPTGNTGAGSGTLQKDGKLGALIGATISIAFYRKIDLMIVLTKDGACRGGDDKLATIAMGDNGQRASQVVFFVNGANSLIPVNRVKQQIGARRSDNGQVDTSVLVSKSDVNCASAIGAAILYFNGISIGDIRKIYPLFGSDADVLNALALRI